MKPPLLLRVVLFLGLAWLAGPQSRLSAAPEPAGTPVPSAAPAPEPVPSQSATPTAKARPLPFRSKVVSVHKSGGTFRMGKKKIRVVHVLPETKLFKGDGVSVAVFKDLAPGAEVRGSLRKRADGEYDALSLKIGPKAAAPTPAGTEILP